MVLKPSRRQAAPPQQSAIEMTHYVAIIEDAGPDHAVGVWFPDLPGCFSAGNTLDEAMAKAPEALALWIESMVEDGKATPRARTPARRAS